MKKQLFPFATIVAFVFLVITGCGKEDDNTTPAKTKTELITQGSWKFSTATVSGASVVAALQQCQKDNIMTFVAVGLTGSIDEGASKCNAADPQTNPFTWSFASGETVLNISATLFTSGSNTFTLVDLSETQLVASQVITIGSSPQTVVVTFIH